MLTVAPMACQTQALKGLIGIRQWLRCYQARVFRADAGLISCPLGGWLDVGL